ncbi:hypothetical protein [Campylobacter concisus]|uniref:hypothetical protein n=1 Tax=Campylobacter concisus TaxID=199 RepID=UPI0015E182FF|nr:hypothetical protein [Campylobacter concisus]
MAWALLSSAILNKRAWREPAAFEASKIGGEIAYSIRDDDKAVLYAVSKLFL